MVIKKLLIMSLSNMIGNSLFPEFGPEHDDQYHPHNQFIQQPQQSEQNQQPQQHQLRQQHQIPQHPQHLQLPDQDCISMDSDLKTRLRTEGVRDITIHRLTVNGQWCIESLLRSFYGKGLSRR